MQQLQIKSMRIGYSNSILIINGENSILVDTGIKNHAEIILQEIINCGLKPTDIKLIILTHTHFDHAANAHYLKEKTGAKIVVHENEKESLERGYKTIPKGTLPFTKISSWLGRNVVPFIGKYNAVEAEITVKEKLDLNPWKIDGYILHTPGHTSGSISVIINKSALTGDTFFNRGYNIIFPPFADSPETLIKTWHKIFQLGITEIYPGHGVKFNVEKAFPDFEKWKKKLNIMLT